MKNKEVKEEVTTIVSDSMMPIDERIDAVLSLTPPEDAKDEDAEEKASRLELTAFCFSSLIGMIKDEKEIAPYTEELFELYALLAETYDEMRNYRPLERLSFDVREVMRDTRIAWDVIADTVPRIIDVLSDSVYHYETYYLLMDYIFRAYKEGKLDSSMKGRVRNSLKLNLLLENNNWSYHWHDQDFQDAVASLFTNDELLKIIIRPEIGHLKRDPVEYTRRWEEIYYDLEERLDQRFANAPRHMGFCFRYWSAKRELLEEEYGIEWKSPSQMNPGVRFD